MKITTEKNIIKIIVKPNKPRNEITGYDNNKDAYMVNIKEKAEKGKANKEVIKFFSKLSKKKVKIIFGLKSKEKLLKVL